MSRPVWLRRGPSYRAYIRGLRVFLICAVLIVAIVLLLKSGLLPDPVAALGIVVVMLVGAVAIVTAAVGWIRVPDKNRANVDQFAFLWMIVRDIFSGIPNEDGRGSEVVRWPPDFR